LGLALSDVRLIPVESGEESLKTLGRKAIPEKSITSEGDFLWQKVLEGIEQEVTRANFEAWFKEIRLIELSEGVAKVGIPGEFVKRPLEKRFYSLIQRHLTKTLGKKIELSFEV
jgi:hypothetical protein